MNMRFLIDTGRLYQYEIARMILLRIIIYLMPFSLPASTAGCLRGCAAAGEVGEGELPPQRRRPVLAAAGVGGRGGSHRHLGRAAGDGARRVLGRKQADCRSDWKSIEHLLVLEQSSIIVDDWLTLHSIKPVDCALLTIDHWKQKIVIYFFSNASLVIWHTIRCELAKPIRAYES